MLDEAQLVRLCQALAVAVVALLVGVHYLEAAPRGGGGSARS